MTSMTYGIVIEAGERNFSAYVPDLPGCVATGASVEETRRLIRKAIELHLEGIREDGGPVPQPRTICDNVEVA
jgi:predicted RNase H-like HicB family nuclease